MRPIAVLPRLVYKVALVDLVLVYALFSVLQDLDWRTYYAGTPHAAVPSGYAASFSYSVHTRFFTMSAGNVTLTSPPTLDWVQLVVIALVVVNAWFAYVALRDSGHAWPWAPRRDAASA